jgi:hypothetical protein
MSKKSGNGLEKHIDKIILAVAGIVGLYVLYMYVLTSPNMVEYNGKWYGPADLDKAIYEQAKNIEDTLNKPPKENRSYRSKLSEFNSMFASPTRNIGENTVFPFPHPGSADESRIYTIPRVGDINNVKARLLTAVAYVPKKPLKDGDPYAAAEVLPGDLDFITVEATIDAAELSKRFSQSFKAAKKQIWTKPVFAAVQLERQRSLENGAWSDWQIVPRTNIDDYRSRFNISQKADKLDKSIEILMLQFSKPQTREQLLQPGTYDFAYPAESWLPPTLAQKRQEKMEKAKAEQRHAETLRRAEEEKTKTRTSPRPAPAAGAKASPAAMPGGGGMGMPGMGGGGGGMGMPGMGGAMPGAAPRQAQPAKATRTAEQSAAARGTKTAVVKTDTLSDEQEFLKVRLTDKTDFAAMKEPLLFWTHDDTAEQGMTYRYRIKIGVFNPVAGTNSFSDTDKPLRNDIVLWSGYSAVTEPITVPQRWYFFPLNYRETDKMVNMHVCRYVLAKWYSMDFRVRPGEIIGAVAENVKTEDAGEYEPNEIDYSNNAVLVDVITATENYENVLYTADMATIEHLGIKSQNWPAALKEKFSQIETIQKEQKEQPPVFIPRGSEGRRAVERTGTTPAMPGGMPGMMPGMPMPGMMPGMPVAPR